MINNGQERIEKMRKAMHREIDRLIDDVIIGGNVTEFTVTFDGGIDRVLSVDLRVDRYVKDDNGQYIALSKKIEQEADDENI